jgi:dienelactone hydrolase
MTVELPGFSHSVFDHDGIARSVYRRGEGRAVIVIHEVPGITPQVREFAERVAAEGFTVFMPSLFGTPNKAVTQLYNAQQILAACIRREFSVLASRQASPITDWLRALCRHAHEELGGPGVGVVGMCLTGNFALALMADETVMAPVLSQPSLPFGLTAAHKRAVHVSDEQLRIAKRRSAEGVTLLGLRFTHDFMCPKARFDTLRRELGDGFEAIEIDSSPGNPHGIPRIAHSVLTNDLVDEAGHPTHAALARVLELFHERLDETGA